MHSGEDRRQGFSLIELLVVIAVLGMLAALVLTAVGSARDKAFDARVKSGVRQLRAAVEVFYDGNGYSYDGWRDCVLTPNATNCLDQGTANDVTVLKADIDVANGITDSTAVEGAGDEFCVSAPLRNSPTNYVCADATGVVREGPSAAVPCETTPVCTFT